MSEPAWDVVGENAMLRAKIADLEAACAEAKKAADVLAQAYDADAIADWFMDTDADGIDVRAIVAAYRSAKEGDGQ